MITLKRYAQLTGLDPCALAGFDSCFSCEKRAFHIAAVESAQSMADDWLRTRHRRRLLPTADTISQTSPIVCADGFEFVTRTTYKGTATLSYVLDGSDGCGQLMRAEIDPTDLVIGEGETIVDVSTCPEFLNLQCKRFPVEWESFEIVDESALYAYASAYNFIDYDLSPIGFSEDTVVHLAEMPFCVVTEKPSIPMAVWELSPCGCVPDPCETESTEACFKRLNKKCYRIVDIEPCAACRECGKKPLRFDIDILWRGIQTLATDQAIISWANTLLPEEACTECGGGIMSSRWHRDVSIAQGDVVTYGEWFARRVLGSAADTLAVGGL